MKTPHTEAWVRDLHVRPETTKPLEANTGEKLHAPETAVLSRGQHPTGANKGQGSGTMSSSQTCVPQRAKGTIRRGETPYGVRETLTNRVPDMGLNTHNIERVPTSQQHRTKQLRKLAKNLNRHFSESHVPTASERREDDPAPPSPGKHRSRPA